MVVPAVELRAIEVFLVLVEELHFARTAERVGLTPSRVSQIIRQLERHAGGPLFERTSRHVTPTNRGTRLHRDLGAAYHLIDDAFSVALLEECSPPPPDEINPAAQPMSLAKPLDPSDTSRPVTIGVSGWTNEFQQRLITSLTFAASPRAVVTVPSNSTRTRVDSVVAGDLDLAFVRLAQAPTRGLAYRNLVTEPLLLAVPARHPLATEPAEPDPVPLALLNGEPLAFYHREQNPWWYDEVMRGLASNGAEPRIVHRGLWHYDVVSIVSEGRALALLTPTAAATARLEDVVYRRLSPAVLTISQGLIWRHHPSGVTALLVEALTRALPTAPFG